MKTNTANNSTMTAKSVNTAVKQLNQEYNNLFGCLRAILALKDTNNDIPEAKKAIKVLGLNSRKDLDNVATKVLNYYPLQAKDVSGKIVAFERVTKRKTETKESYKIEQPITKWTIKKVLQAVRVIEGTKDIQVIE